MPNHHNSNGSSERPTRTPNFPGRNLRTERCPDCEIEGRLNIVGQPIYRADLGFQLTLGCETCGGTGHVRRTTPMGIDPYELPRKG